MRSPTFYAGLSIATSVVTIALKFGAYWVTGSVGLLSDAIEAFVNIAAALVALGALTYAAGAAGPRAQLRPREGGVLLERHRGRADLRGRRGDRLDRGAAPHEPAADRASRPGPRALGAGRGRQRGVRVGDAEGRARAPLDHARGRRASTCSPTCGPRRAWWWACCSSRAPATCCIDPIVAILVALQVLWTGWHLIHRSFQGLMDRAFADEEIATDHRGARHAAPPGLRLPRAAHAPVPGARGFVDVHVLVPGQTSVQEGHDMVEDLGTRIIERLPHVEVLIHLEPLEDPKSYEDTPARRKQGLQVR